MLCVFISAFLSAWVPSEAAFHRHSGSGRERGRTGVWTANLFIDLLLRVIHVHDHYDRSDAFPTIDVLRIRHRVGQRSKNSLKISTLIGKETFDTTCILDSGADVSAISKEMAEVLGLNIHSKTETINGVGGPIEAIKSQMIAIIEKGHERYQLKLPVHIMINEFNFPPLLGRTGFFREFEIVIKEKKLRIELKKLSDSEYKKTATSR